MYCHWNTENRFHMLTGCEKFTCASSISYTLHTIQVGTISDACWMHVPFRVLCVTYTFRTYFLSAYLFMFTYLNRSTKEKNMGVCIFHLCDAVVVFVRSTLFTLFAPFTQSVWTFLSSVNLVMFRSSTIFKYCVLEGVCFTLHTVGADVGFVECLVFFLLVDSMRSTF